MSMEREQLQKVSELCEEVLQLIAVVHQQGTTAAVEWNERMAGAEGVGGQRTWLLWPSKKTAELRRRSMDLTRALAELRR